MSSKILKSHMIAMIEIGVAALVTLTLLFNYIKTEKLGKQYDELNLTASDYTIYIDINGIHKDEFNAMYEK